MTPTEQSPLLVTPITPMTHIVSVDKILYLGIARLTLVILASVARNPSRYFCVGYAIGLVLRSLTIHSLLEIHMSP